MINKENMRVATAVSLGTLESRRRVSTLETRRSRVASVKNLTLAGTNGSKRARGKRRRARVRVNVANSNGPILHDRGVAVCTLVPRCHAANYGSEHRYLIRLFREGGTIERGPASQSASQHTNRKLPADFGTPGRDSGAPRNRG